MSDRSKTLTLHHYLKGAIRAMKTCFLMTSPVVVLVVGTRHTMMITAILIIKLYILGIS